MSWSNVFGKFVLIVCVGSCGLCMCHLLLIHIIYQQEFEKSFLHLKPKLCIVVTNNYLFNIMYKVNTFAVKIDYFSSVL